MTTHTTPSPFHVGEQQVQKRLGVREGMEDWGRKIIRGHLPDEHRAFYAQLPFLVAAARDARGRPWATLLAGPPGFVRTPDEVTLGIDAHPVRGDALDGALTPGADVGFLGIELATRRRNRVNGRVSGTDARGFDVAVDQTFGNCPQYIHERDWREAEAAEAPVRRTHARFTPALRAWIEGAGTFFVASGHRPARAEGASFGMDASHRGGEPGFVRVEDERTLVFPDYAGNNHYNTIGNLVLDPRLGITFVDFEGGGLLQLTGRTEITWEPCEADLVRFPGARRLVRLTLDEAVELEAALPLRFSATSGGVRSLRLVEKRRESAEITSFVFVSRDAGPLPDFRAGQHLPLELKLEGGMRVSRTYSLSNGPGRERYRISVKRHERGLVSRLLHDQLEEGAMVDARAPAGDFVLDDASPRPVVLVSAGVGLTPMLSMLHELVERGDGRPVWFVHGARDGAHHALAEEVAGLAGRAPSVRVHTAYSRPRAEDRERARFDSVGRVDGALLESLLPDLEADFYVCGPTGFMASLQGELEARGVPAERIHSEAF